MKTHIQIIKTNNSSTFLDNNNSDDIVKMKINGTYFNVRYKHLHMKCTSLPKKPLLEHSVKIKWKEKVKKYKEKHIKMKVFDATRISQK